jgi:hypothetical protein
MIMKGGATRSGRDGFLSMDLNALECTHISPIVIAIRGPQRRSPGLDHHGLDDSLDTGYDVAAVEPAAIGLPVLAAPTLFRI